MICVSLCPRVVMHWTNSSFSVLILSHKSSTVGWGLEGRPWKGPSGFEEVWVCKSWLNKTIVFFWLSRFRSKSRSRQFCVQLRFENEKPWGEVLTIVTKHVVLVENEHENQHKVNTCVTSWIFSQSSFRCKEQTPSLKCWRSLHSL